MIQSPPFLYQAIDGIVYHVAEKGVVAVQSWLSEEKIVVFVDGDKGDYEPKDSSCVAHWHDAIINCTVQLIVASCLKGAYKKWTKHTGHVSFVTKLAVKLWLCEELFLTGLVSKHCFFQQSTDASAGYSFIPMISLSSCSGSRPRISATTLVDALKLPYPSLNWK